MANKENRNIAVIVVLILFLPSINFYLNNIFSAFNLSVLLYGFLFVSEFFGIIIALRSHLIEKRAHVLVLTIVLLAVLSYILYNDTIGSRLIRQDFHPFYSEMLFLFLFSLPSFLLSTVCVKWDLVLDYLTKISPFIIVLAVYSWSMAGFKTWGEGSMNYMVLPYYALTAGCVCVAKSFSGFHPLYWFVSLLFFLLIIAAGCRGALVCSLVFLVLLTYRNINLASKKLRILFVLGVFLSCLIIPIIYNNVSIWLENFGISSRIVAAISDETFFSSNSRDDIRNAVFKGVADNPLGYGLYGDRYLIGKYYQEGVDYSHNLFVEFLADFGVFIGPVFFLMILYKVLSYVHKRKRTIVGMIMLILLPDGIVKLFFSGSFLDSVSFFIIIGILLSSKKLYVSKNDVIK